MTWILFPKNKLESFFIFKKTPFMVKQMGECPIVNIFFNFEECLPINKQKNNVFKSKV
jgi:hypothetical protein